MILTHILNTLCTLALAAIAVIDLKTYEIPVGYNLFIGVLGIIRLFTDLPNWQQYVIGFFAVSSLFFTMHLFTKGNGIGGGDVKLMAAAGLFLGWKRIFLALAIGSFTALVVHTALIIFKKKGHMLAFGPYLSVGIFCALLANT